MNELPLHRKAEVTMGAFFDTNLLSNALQFWWKDFCAYEKSKKPSNVVNIHGILKSEISCRE